MISAKNSTNPEKYASNKLMLHYAALDTMKSGVALIKKSDHTFLYTNPAFDKIYGYPKEILKGKYLEILNGKKEDDENNLFPTDRDEWEGELIQKNIHEEYLTINTRITSFYSEDTGKIWVRVDEDVTLKRKQEKALIDAWQKAAEANAAKTQFLSVMSHELRTPLNGILGIIDVLENEINSQNYLKTKDRVDIIRNSGKYLLQLINDILSINKIEAGKLELSYIKFNLFESVKEVIESLKSNTKSKNINITQEISLDLPAHFTGDEIRIKQVIYNLLSNAIKNTEEGFIKVKIGKFENKEDMLQINIEDSGCGIPYEDQSRIFGLFEQVDSSSNRKYQGSGLGLFISKNLVDLMGGKIWFTSVPNKGTTFSFTIKLEFCKNWKNEGKPTRYCSVCTVRNSELNINPEIDKKHLSKKILIVEDSPVNELVLSEVLKSIGFENIESTDNGFDAISMTSEKEFDIIFLDIHLPEMDGYEIAGHILKKDPNTKKPMIIACTADAMEENIKKCLEVGMIDYIMKPFSTETLKNKLLSHLPSR